MVTAMLSREARVRRPGSRAPRPDVRHTLAIGALESDPARSRKHISLSAFAERRLRANQKMVGAFLGDVNLDPGSWMRSELQSRLRD